MSPRTTWAFVGLVLASLPTSGCNELVGADRFSFGGDGGVGVDSGAMDAALRDGGERDGGAVDAGPDACGPEICNGVDDDCDSEVDEEPATSICGAAGATVECAGELGCRLVACDEGWLDCDDEPSTGCEVDPTTDPSHCGECANACVGGLGCAEGECGRVLQVAAGAHHTCALRAGGTVWCWGQNDSGQLGDSTRTTRSEPAPVEALADAVEISCGALHCCARREGGTVWCWGANEVGQLGDGAGGTGVVSDTPTEVSDLTDAVEIEAGESHACARRAIGGVVCWGDGRRGQLASGERSISLVPVAALDLDDALDLFGGSVARQMCAHAPPPNDMRCWGENENGQLGDGTSDRSDIPVDVMGADMLDSAAPGEAHTCFAQGRRAWCVGANASGQLGNGDTAAVTTVDMVDLPTDVVQLAAGFQTTCALRVGGGVSCFGNGMVGTLGHGMSPADPQPDPVDVVGLSDAEALTAGFGHVCALRATGEIACWGFNMDGQLGDGSMMDRASPVEVVFP